MPQLILLDLKMPKMDGIEFFAASGTMKDKVLPVVIPTTSTEEKDRIESYRLARTAIYVSPWTLNSSLNRT